MTIESLDLRTARRLALARAGLLRPSWTDFPARTSRANALTTADRVIDRFGYLQLDTVSIAGARSHGLVLLSRLRGFSPPLAEELLRPGRLLFEYWGHEACWMPMDLYPAFGFRREAWRVHPWWGDLISENRKLVDEILGRIEREGPVRSADLEGPGSTGWWDMKIGRKLLVALWTSGDLAIRERVHFHRTFDLPERVIPAAVREKIVGRDESLRILLLRALDGHGWATTGTLARTWRLRNLRKPILQALAELVEDDQVRPCRLDAGGRVVDGWVRPRDLELAARLEATSIRSERGVLLSPFDPVLWDRDRVRLLFGFDQLLEIFKPAAQRRYGYFCLPVLAGEHLVARVDLKANRRSKKIVVLSEILEDGARESTACRAVETALDRLRSGLGLEWFVERTRAGRNEPQEFARE